MKTVPDAAMQTWKGERLRLSQFKDRKIWLAFFRYAACPLCNLRVHEMIGRHEELKKQGVQIIAVFQSDARSIARHVGKQQPSFPLIADPDERLYALFKLRKGMWAFFHPGNIPLLLKAASKGFYDVAPEGTITRIPGDFLISPGLKLHTTYIGKKIGDHIPWNKVERFARS